MNVVLQYEDEWIMYVGIWERLSYSIEGRCIVDSIGATS